MSAAVDGPRSRNWRAASGPISYAQFTPHILRFEEFLAALHVAVPRSDGGAVVDFIFHRFAYPVHERREAFEFRVVGGGRDGAIEGGPLDVGGWAEPALAGGGAIIA